MTTVASKSDRLHSILAQLRANLPEVRGALVATLDGLPIAQAFAGDTDVNRVAAMTATALGLGKRINDTLGAGSLNEMSVSGGQGQVFIYSAGAKGALAVVASTHMNLGLLHLEARDAVRAISGVL